MIKVVLVTGVGSRLSHQMRKGFDCILAMQKAGRTVVVTFKVAVFLDWRSCQVCSPSCGRSVIGGRVCAHGVLEEKCVERAMRNVLQYERITLEVG